MGELEQMPAVETGGEDGASAVSDEIAATVEAILFASDGPLTAAKIVQVAELPGQRVVRQAVEALNARYERAGSAFRIESIAGGYQILTLPEYHDVLSRLSRARSESRLSQASLETLAIIAYRQPVLRADVEAIRGVACGEVLRGLLEKDLVKIVGRAQVLGRPLLYGTTRHFLEVFGLSSLDELPHVEELRAAAEGPQAKAGGEVEQPPADQAAESPGAGQEGRTDEPADPSAPAAVNEGDAPAEAGQL